MDELTAVETDQYNEATAREVATYVLTQLAEQVTRGRFEDLLTSEDYELTDAEAKPIVARAMELLATVKFQYPTT